MKQCTYSTPATMVKCYIQDCEKVLHHDCYKMFVLRKNNIEHFNENNLNYVVYNKRH